MARLEQTQSLNLEIQNIHQSSDGITQAGVIVNIYLIKFASASLLQEEKKLFKALLRLACSLSARHQTVWPGAWAAGGGGGVWGARHQTVWPGASAGVGVGAGVWGARKWISHLAAAACHHQDWWSNSTDFLVLIKMIIIIGRFNRGNLYSLAVSIIEGKFLK